MATSKRIDECPLCAGRGVTPETAPVIVQEKEGFRTIRQGSGCPKCHGVGYIDQSKNR